MTIRTVLLPALSLTALAQVPTELPDPDGLPGDSSLPVQVYILAGQSNMVGMGDVGGARIRYSGVFLTADPGAPSGTVPPNGHLFVWLEEARIPPL